MKRGFLNSSKAKKRPVGSPPRETIYHRLPIGKQNVEVPAGYDAKTHFIERDPRLGTGVGGMTITTVPFVDFEGYPGEPRCECLFHAGSKEVLMNLPGFPQPMQQPPTTTFRLSDTPGKGVGLFATRALKTGDLVFSDRPLLLCATGIPTDVPEFFTQEQVAQQSLRDLEKMVGYCVQRMDAETKEAYMALKNSHLEDGSGPLVGILRTNGIGLEGLRPGVTDPTQFYSAVCKNLSRFNHSCSPNMARRWDMLSFSYQVFAVRDIAPGEELTYQYIPLEIPTAYRQELLKPYDFTCACLSCTDPESDARRANLNKSGGPSVFHWLFNPPQADAWLFSEIRRQLKLVGEEKMEATFRYFELLNAGFEACIAMGDAIPSRRSSTKILWDCRGLSTRILCPYRLD
ncbi:hypothetical protein FB45DRAFT_845823 [Roridomyces roridus]|uniref:SET domain-containing protein n=1 Tax=Roridomyces roridus TaxID=1738132 RepID=A0AAD7B343_9AGAR|nr:hypothetical protein FB45DRAFT_845823 [Roridomyces roridus]